MSKYRFEATLSTRSIDKMIKDLNNYKENILQKKLELLVKTLAEKGVEIAQNNIVTYDAIFTTELINSIHTRKKSSSDKDTAIFYVVADSKHAVFVEFGTGQMGEEGGYPYEFPEGVEWKYNEGKTIFEVAPGEYGWFYPKNGKWYFTQGMPARPFMYETNIELFSLVEKTAKEVFG